MDREIHKIWLNMDGNNTYVITHPLNENSNVIELGGYDGTWVNKIRNRYNPNIYILEPVKQFYDNLCIKFYNNPKIRIYNVGISTSCKNDFIYIDNDSTSTYIKNNKMENAEFWSIEKTLSEINLSSIDLVQINIEGEEYNLLDHLLNSEFIYKFKRLQIQFHNNIDDYDNRREKIQNKFLEIGYKKLWDYPFIFECWERIDK